MSAEIVDLALYRDRRWRQQRAVARSSPLVERALAAFSSTPPDNSGSTPPRAA